MISTKDFTDAAELLGVEVAAIKAVAEVESGGAGFLSTGEPVILFEPHVFWRELVKRGIEPERYASFSDVLYKKWGEKPYGKSSEQHARLQRACLINREAALCSASWGRFQIMGNNHALCGCKTIQDFINKIYESEREHLMLFCHYIKNTGLVRHLKAKDWEAFARGYNGPGYAKNAYHKKMNTAYLKHRAA